MTTSTVASAVTPANAAQLRYRLDVVAFDVIDVVRSAGGWLFDRAMAGWDVNVLLPQALDVGPLQILGVRSLDLESELSAVATGLAVSAEAFAANAGIREKVSTALNHSLTEVTLWGDEWPRSVDRATTAVHHSLSAAACAFKRHALAAAGISAAVAPTETLRSDRSPWLPV